MGFEGEDPLFGAPVDKPFAKVRARLSKSSRLHYMYRFISWESEELDEGPQALFLIDARKSLGSCQLGDTMDALPKQFR
jgi:hypothetical protein